MKYDDLPEAAKEVIDTTEERFADLFDNDQYGPYVKEVSTMGRDRMAALLDMGIGNLYMLMGTTGMAWTVETYPYAMPIGRQVAILALTVETIQHLIRSYVEIPDTSRIGAPDIQRRDYLTRWQSVLRDYQEQLKAAARKMDAELYSANFSSNVQVLVDYPSYAGFGMGSARMGSRPNYGMWY